MSKPPHNQRGNRPVAPQSPQQPSQQQQQVSVHAQTAWSGPLPSPAALERFNEIIPNGADRIVKMAESEQEHRIDYEKKGLAASTREAAVGQFLGAFISLAAIGAAAYTASIGAHWAVSAALVGIPVLGLVRAVVRPRR